MNITTSQLENLIYEELSIILEQAQGDPSYEQEKRARKFAGPSPDKPATTGRTVRKTIEKFFDWMQEQSIDDIFAHAPRDQQRKTVKAFFKHIGYKLPEYKKQVTKVTQQGGRWDVVPTGEWKTVKANIDEFVDFYSGKSDTIYARAPTHKQFYPFFLRYTFEPLKAKKLNESIMLMGEDVKDFLVDPEDGINVYSIREAFLKAPNLQTFNDLYLKFNYYVKKMRVELTRFKKLDKAWQLKQEKLFGTTLVTDPEKLDNMSETAVHSYLEDIYKLTQSYQKLISYKHGIMYTNVMAFLEAKTLVGNLAVKRSSYKGVGPLEDIPVAVTPDTIAAEEFAAKRAEREKALLEFIEFEIEHVLIFAIPYRGINITDPDYWTAVFGSIDSVALMGAWKTAYAAEGTLAVRIIAGLKFWTQSMLIFYLWTKWAQIFAEKLVEMGDYLIYKPPSDYTEGELVDPLRRRKHGRRAGSGVPFTPPRRGTPGYEAHYRKDRGWPGALSPTFGKTLKDLQRVRVKLGKGVQKALKPTRIKIDPAKKRAKYNEYGEIVD